jgi:glycosyltransferase involved in cell wall biosynthesis
MPEGLRILMGCLPDKNPVIAQLINALSDNASISCVHCSADGFWRRPQRYDVLHIQWPEALTNWQEPSEAEIAALKAGLQAWKIGTRIVVTVHNRFPHNHDTKRFRELYNIVYSAADGIIHLGRASLEEFSVTYPAMRAKPQFVILHGNYSCLPNTVTRIEAREWLHICNKEYVCLSFGELRNNREVRLLLQGFRLLRTPRKRLVIAGRLRASPNRLASLLCKWHICLRRNILHINAYIPDCQVQYYLHACDVMVIPRIASLNSGNVALGFTFGKVVVGPNDGVIGEMLRENGNPVFDPGNIESLACALQEGLRFGQTDLGDQNRIFALKQLNWSRIAAQHESFYRLLLQKARVKESSP